MNETLKALVEKTAADIMITTGINVVNKNDKGFATTVDDNKKLIIGCMCFHCMENMVIFSDEQINNINNIINKL